MPTRSSLSGYRPFSGTGAPDVIWSEGTIESSLASISGRPAISTSVGGVPDVVEPGRNGLLVGPGKPDELAGALIRVLGDRKFAEQLADGARGSAEAARWAPGAYAQSVREMIDRVMAGP